MKKASKILLLVGGIMSLVLAGIVLILSITFTVLGSPAVVEAIREGIEKGQITTSAANTEAAVIIFQSTMITTAIFFYIWTVILIINGIIALISRGKTSKGLYIASIILGFASGVEVNAVGGIFGIIGTRRERREQIIDVESK